MTANYVMLGEMTKPTRIGIILASAAVLLLIAGWLGRPAYRHFREKRSLAFARESLKKNDLRSADIALKRTLEINPNNLEAVQIRGDLATEFQTPDALAWRQRAVEISPTFENKLLMAATGLKVERPPLPITTQLLQELQAAGAETNAAYHLVAYQVAIRQNRPGDAEKHLQAVIQFDPTNRLHQLNLATIRLRAKDPAVADSARRELTGLTTDPALGPHALRALITDAFGDRRFDEADRLSTQLLALPQARLGDRLQRLSVLYESHSQQLAPQLAGAKTLTSTNAFQIAILTDWLNAHGMASDAVNWLDSLPPKMLANPPLPAVKADCYIALRDWAGLEQYLTRQRWDDQEYMRLAYLTRALREQNRREMAGAQWQRAMTAAGNRVESLDTLAELATRWGWAADADDALWAIVRRAPWNNFAWRALINNRTKAGDTQGLYRIYSAQLDANPDSLPAKNNVAIIALLLHVDSDRANRLAREVFQAQPTNSTFVSTYAFALYLQDKTTEGLKLMQALPVTELRRPDIAAYQAILLAAAGQRELARPYFELAEKASLLPEEKRLLEKAAGRS